MKNYWKDYGGFHKWGYPKIDGLFHGKSENQMDDYGGTPMTQETSICVQEYLSLKIHAARNTQRPSSCFKHSLAINTPPAAFAEIEPSLVGDVGNCSVLCMGLVLMVSELHSTNLT